LPACCHQQNTLQNRRKLNKEIKQSKKPLKPVPAEGQSEDVYHCTENKATQFSISF